MSLYILPARCSNFSMSMDLSEVIATNLSRKSMYVYNTSNAFLAVLVHGYTPAIVYAMSFFISNSDFICSKHVEFLKHYAFFDMRFPSACKLLCTVEVGVYLAVLVAMVLIVWALYYMLGIYIQGRAIQSWPLTVAFITSIVAVFLVSKLADYISQRVEERCVCG